MRAHELTELASNWLAEKYPKSTIVKEMSVDDWGGARIDVAAITDEKIIGVEVKGDGDSPARLDLQGLVYGKVAREMWLLVTPEGTLRKRCLKKKPRGWGVLEVHGDYVRPINKAEKLGPIRELNGRMCQRMEPDNDRYEPDAAMWSIRQCPWAMCGTLWRDELYGIARLNGLKIKGSARVGDITDAICDQIPAPKIHDAMIVELRRRVWRKAVLDLRK